MALTRQFELRSLLAMASEKDTGLDIEAFRDSLRSFESLTPADFGVSGPEYEHLRNTVTEWLHDLDPEPDQTPPGSIPEPGR